MAYIGRGLELGQHKKQDIVVTGNPNTIVDYAMDLNASQNSLLVVYGNVIQEPGISYTVVGTTITFTSAPAASTSLYIIYLGQELTSVSNPSTAEVTTLATTIAQTEAAALAIALGG